MEKLIIRKDFTPRGELVISFCSNVTAEIMRFNSIKEYHNFLCLIIALEIFGASSIEKTI